MALLTLFAVAGLVDWKTGELALVLDPSAGRLLPASGEARDQYERSRTLFGSDEPFVVAIGGDDIFQPDVLEAIVQLTERLELLPEVRRVLSLATAPALRAVDGDIEIGPFLLEVPQTPEALAALRQMVLDDPIYRGSLVAADGGMTAVLVYLRPMEDSALVSSGISQRIEDLARSVFEELAGGAGVEVSISGVPHITAVMSETLLDELIVVLPVTLLLLCGVLALAFRSAVGVWLPIATVSLALLWTLGLLCWLGQELNLVTTILPPLVVTVGFAYAMHVVADFQTLARGESDFDAAARRRLAGKTVDEVAMPILLTGLTTGAGFASLTVSPIVAIQEFGLLAVLGVVSAVLASLTFAPAALALWPFQPPATGSGGDRLDRLATRLADFSVRRRVLVIGTAVAVMAVSVLAMTRIQVATEFVGNFDLDNPLRRDYEAINAGLGGANTLSVVIESDATGTFLEPENLALLEELQTWIAAQPEVGHTTSVVDYIKLINRALHDGEPEYLALPETKRQASQLMLFGASDETQRLVDARYQMANVMIRATVGDSRSIRDLVDRIETRLAALPAQWTSAVTGNLVLFSESIDDVASGQWTSMLVAFTVIYLVLAGLFMSFRTGLRALFPNVLPIAVYFGTLGATGITLNPWTSLVGSIALGIAVDDTIHLFARFNADARRLADERRATTAALRAVIRPVTYTTLGLCLGFSVLTMSEVRSQVEFGLLAAMTLFVAWVVDVTLSPALLSGVRIVTLWEVLSLDLGAEPHKEIPLFEGLTKRQARVFVLMAARRELPAGEVLLRERDSGFHGYLVLDGMLRASVHRSGNRVELGDLRRGDLVGESGLFEARRSADVEVIEDASLVRFGPEDLEGLRRRSPRTAALVYRNMNRIQARRLLRTTSRVR